MDRYRAIRAAHEFSFGSITLRSAVALAVISLAGCQSKPEHTHPLNEDSANISRLMSSVTIVSPALDSLLTKTAEVNQLLADDAQLTIYCEAEHVQCHYPSGFDDSEWGCIINHDLNEDGLIDKNEAIYGDAAIERLAQCVRQP